MSCPNIIGDTGANSAIVHSGHDPKPNTLKARFNLEGNRMFPDLCKELQVDYQEIGAFVVSTSEEESQILSTLEQQAKDRQIPYLRLNREEILTQEPHIGDAVKEALSLPTTGIITPWKVTIAAMEEAIENGVELYLNHEVIGIDRIEKGYRVMTNERTFDTLMVINAAGVYADIIAGYLDDAHYQITPRRGEYYILGKLTEPIVNHIIYPVPSSKGKGVLVVPTIHGNVMLGPNSEPILDKDDVSTTNALDEVKKNVVKTVKDIPFQKMIRTFSGLRATGNKGDFVIEEDAHNKNFIHVSCIESPGLTSAPAIAQYVKETFVAKKFKMIKKEHYQRRRPDIVMAHLTSEEKNQLIQKDSRFGRIICRCEKISEGEIIDVIHRHAGATTIDGVKKRCRPGMGGCQGGFCSPEVLAILARELGVDKQDIEYKGKHTEILPAKAKEAL